VQLHDARRDEQTQPAAPPATSRDGQTGGPKRGKEGKKERRKEGKKERRKEGKKERRKEGKKERRKEGKKSHYEQRPNEYEYTVIRVDSR
jgi:hypothetical protein